jgi:hypothetical protein
MPKGNKTGIALLLIGYWIAVQSVFAATIPAGTTLVVRTTQTIDSNDPVGKTFRAELYRDVVVGGKLLLRAGTTVIGQMQSSRVWAFDPVVVNVTKLASQGRWVRITSTLNISFAFLSIGAPSMRVVHR